MKKKLLLTLKILLVALTVGSVAYYVLSIAFLGFSPWDFITLVICAPLITIIVFVKLGIDSCRNALNEVEQKFIKDIGSAFSGEDKKKKQLLYAIYYFSKKHNKKSLKKLSKLKSKCEKTKEHAVVELFRALNYTAMHQSKKAIEIYENAAKNGYINSNMYNNLGHLYAKESNYDLAHKNYDLAIFYEPANVPAYHNKAQLCFKQYDYKKASLYSRKALDIDPNFRPSATLLAIIDSIQENGEKSDTPNGIAEIK
ncbi:MAG: hypothetical protein IJ437_05485 [Clostridia bacterium]|nr:hypothetical protein [Clostridia bacterium]